jgi:hypothetical protein
MIRQVMNIWGRTVMDMKLMGFIIIVVIVMSLSGAVAVGQAQESADSLVVGPYTEILLPLGDLPPLNEYLVYNPTLDQPYTEVVEVSEYSEENDYYISWRETEYFERGAALQILYVLDDPRSVPKARFAYYSSLSERVIPPNNYNPKTVNVYVRVRAPEDKSVHDPIFAGYYEVLPLGSTPALYVSAGVPSDYPDSGFPDLVSCAMPEYANGTEPYSLPAEIEGGRAVGKDGLYDPKAYAPPQPWYYSENEMLEPGEVREGWISCMAPDVPLEDILIYSGYWYTPEPEIQFEGFGFQWLFAENIYLHDPDFSSLEIIGLNASDLPLTLKECTASDHCLTLESRTAVINSEAWGECTEKAKEAGLEQGLCSYLNDPGCPTETLNTAVFYTGTFEEATRDSPLAWSYDKVKPVPEDGIRLDDVSLTFINEKGEKKTAQGSVIFHDPKIVRSGDGYRYYAFMSRVEVEPTGLSKEDLQGYTLSEVGAYVDVFVEHEDTFFSWHSHPDRNLSVDVGFVQPDNPYEGFLFTGIDETSFVWTAKQNTLSSSLPGIAMIRIYPLQEKTDPSSRTKDIYLARAEGFFYHDFESSTNMCEFVDCLNVKDPKDESAVFRTVPMLCAGEWANNFIIEGLDIRVLDRIGEPYGLRDTSSPALFRYYSEDARLFTYRFRVWLYSGRIMGGVTPWWSKDIKNNKDIRDLDGYIVDLRSELFLEERTLTLPYYQEIDKGYYVSALYNQHESGWMAGIIDKKLLIYGPIGEIEEEYGDHTEENTGYMFMDEGPIWITSCQRDLLSTLADQERYAPAEIAGATNFEGSQHEMAAMLPGMVYPVSQPRVTGEILSFGEASAPMSGYVITPEEVKIVPGKPNKPVVYVPSEDKYYPATERVNFNNELFFSRVGAIVIPPDSSFIMIKFKAELPIADAETRCRISGSDFQLSYPGYFPISSVPAWGLIRGWSCRGEDYKSWLYFMFPSLDFDPESMLFSARGADSESWDFWRLTEE